MLKIDYGIEKFGRLRSALLHRPDHSLKLVNENNKDFFLFDKVPNVDKYLEEHSRYEALLRDNGVTVYSLSDSVVKNSDLLDRLPNLAYLHDIAVVSKHGAIISKMSSRGRSHEEVVVGEALTQLGIPKLYEPPEGDRFEGCLLLDEETVFIADTERHNDASIRRFIPSALGCFKQVIYARIPKERRFMHPDMVINRVTENLMVYFPPAFLTTSLITASKEERIDLKDWMKPRGIDLFPLSDVEQRHWGSSFVPLEPGLIINYDLSLNDKTVQSLEREGVRFIHFHPEALLAGGGSLRCLTMRLFRQ